MTNDERLIYLLDS